MKFLNLIKIKFLKEACFERVMQGIYNSFGQGENALRMYIEGVRLNSKPTLILIGVGTASGTSTLVERQLYF